MAAIDAAKSKTILVYLSTKKDNSASFPKGVLDAFKMEGAGKFIPKLAITNSSGEEAIAIVGYETLKVDAKGAIRDALKASEPEEAESASALADRPSFSQENWTSSEGATIAATFRSLDGENLTLILADGRTTVLPLARLSEESQTRAKELANPSE